VKNAGWWLWWAITVLWSAALVVPTPTPAFFGPTDESREFVKFAIGKTAHVLAYTTWTVLTGWLRPAFGVRLLLLFFLLAHAVVTEWVQLHLSYRSGSLRDAGLDHGGVLLGLFVGWRWWTAGTAPPGGENG
jgi:VanZ family protein